MWTFFKLQLLLYKMLKPFDFLCGYSNVISLSSDDVSPPDGDDIISLSSACLLLLKWLLVKIHSYQVFRLTFLGNKNLKWLR